MSAFEVIVTPTRLKTKREESREPTDVIMAPFSSKSIVQFEDVPVTKTAKRILKIVNPSDDDIEVKVTKPIKSDHNLTIDWIEKIVPANKCLEMEMIWTPHMEVTCKETLQLMDNRNFRKDVMIILKSVPNKPAKTTRKFPTVSSSAGTHTKTLRLKSPKGSTKNNKPTTAQTQQQQRKRLISHMSEKPMTQHSDKPNVVEQSRKELLPVQRMQPTHISPLAERNNIKSDECISAVSPLVLQQHQQQHKENVSPLTPNNVLSLIDNMKFTPANNETATGATERLDNLASWPTPVNQPYYELTENKVVREIRPRRLTAAELTAEDEAVAATTAPQITVDMALNDSRDITSHIITNKTFEVRTDGSLESLDGSVVDARVMNKTTTICTTPCARPLEMIQEEDGSPIVEKEKRKPTDLDEALNMKRDIKLVGTPLRKYSESMKDLSLKSPKTNIPIQGSMPNLNEMEQIRSIEQNRYYYQATAQKPDKTITVESGSRTLGNQHKSMNDSLDNSSLSSSQHSLVSPAEFMFNKNEILAQSSRFNLHEIGGKSRKNSPVMSKVKGGTKSSTVVSRQTPPSAGKKPSPTESAQKRRSRELSFSDSPSTESIASSCGNNNRNSHKSCISPPKRLRVDADSSFQRAAPTNASSMRVKNWPQSTTTQQKKYKLAKTLSLTKKPLTPRKTKDEPRIKLYDSDLFLQPYINPDPFAATTTCDPFLASTMYLDERAVDRHQTDFKKWLNALVTIPADLDTDPNAKIDVGKLFSEVRNKELMLAPTKEEQSMNYLTKFRLESLRRAAVQLFLSEEMRAPCSKVAVYVNKNAIRIRSDRNLHLDVVMQRYILELLLYFNPLWLRLGLEVVYGEKIHLHSNGDIVGLSTFILNRLFRDKFLEQKYSKAYTLSDEYAEHIKKFTLQKMLFLLLFLDRAKRQHIVQHNPCLFVKKSPFKEPKEILLRFASELLANIGDITRELKRLGYVLQHKQTYLDEFDYAFNNLAVDLRDGIRLTRVMEIILLRSDLSTQLRVPAISRLQRIFNVNLALRALSEADFQLRGDITAADIVDGHREKTLSLLWQIIYKFRSPKFHAAAAVLQQWWRRSWLRVVVQRRIRHKEQLRREAAATLIQAKWRGYVTRQFAKVYRAERTDAAVIVQKYMRRHLAQKHLHRAVRAVVLLQRWCRAQQQARECRQRYLTLRNNTIYLQRCIRRYHFSRKLLQASQVVRDILAEVRLRHAKARVLQRCFRSVQLHRKWQRLVLLVVRQQRQNCREHKAAARIKSFMQSLRLQREFQATRQAVTRLQTRWRGYLQMCRVRERFLLQRQAAITLQRHYRAKKSMKMERHAFLKLQAAAIRVQRRYRAQQLMRKEHERYLQLRNSTINMQRRRRALLQMRLQRSCYLRQRDVIIQLQCRVRATLAMRLQRSWFLRKRAAACTLQRHYRARLEMRRQLCIYQHMRRCILRIQTQWRATRLSRRLRVEYLTLQYYTCVLQQKYRANKLMRAQRTAYIELRTSTICVQRRYRATLQMRLQRAAYLRVRQAAVTLQCRYRAYKLMRFMRAKYSGTRAAVNCIQQYVRGYQRMRREREQFLRQQRAAITLQRAFRAWRKMRAVVAVYQRVRMAAITLQRHYRARLNMLQTRATYARQRTLIIAIQRRYRGLLLMRTVRADYAQKRQLIIQLQRRRRATLLMRVQRTAYEATRVRIICIQRKLRAQLAMKSQRFTYVRQRRAASCIQAWYRAVLKQRQEQQTYKRVRTSSLTIQRKWRATRAARAQRQLFLQTVQKVVRLQRVLRATLLMREASSRYQQQRSAAIVLQRRYRARRLMLQMRSQFLLLRSLIVCVQRKYRARCAMLEQRQQYQRLRCSAVQLQQRWRARQQMRKERSLYVKLQRSTLQFQAQARGYLARRQLEAMMTPEMMEFQRQKHAAKLIQRFWRGYRIRKRWRNARILQIRKNIKLLRETSTAVNSIRWKVHDAVRLLRGRFSASDALHVLTRLERLSRTVPHMLMGHSDFISTFCYGIMAQAIRSEVDKQLIEYCSRIILNLARYNSTTANTFQQGGLVTIAQMLLRWCNKDCEIFNTLCTLIWIFSHCPQKRNIIREFMTTPEAIYVVRETKKLVARKEKMKQNVRKPQVVRDQSPTTNFSSRALPSLEPDYGVIRSKPYTFISSVYAFDTILCKLGIDIF